MGRYFHGEIYTRGDKNHGEIFARGEKGRKAVIYVLDKCTNDS